MKKSEQKVRAQDHLKKNKTRPWYKQRWFVITASLAAASVLAITLLMSGADRPDTIAEGAYPDLEDVSSGNVPEDFDAEHQPTLGDPNAPFQIVEFSDYKCPYCKLWTEEVFSRLKTEYIDSGIVQFVYVDMAFLAPDSVLAALAGETLYQMNPDYFWQYHERMTEKQGDKNTEWATYDFITELVKNEMPQVPLDEFKQLLQDQTYISNVKRDLDIAEKHGVRGTPTIIINGEKLEDPTFAELSDYIEKNLNAQ